MSKNKKHKEAYLHTKWRLKFIQLFGHNGRGPKIVGCVPFGEYAWYYLHGIKYMRSCLCLMIMYLLWTILIMLPFHDSVHVADHLYIMMSNINSQQDKFQYSWWTADIVYIIRNNKRQKAPAFSRQSYFTEVGETALLDYNARATDKRKCFDQITVVQVSAGRTP